jgi:protein O-mannosyl-transferase
MNESAKISSSCACTAGTESAPKPFSLAALLERKDYLYTFLFLLGVLPYLNTLRNGLVYDDNDQVINNPFILNAHHIWQIFTTPVWVFKTASPTVAYFRPMMNLTFLGLHSIYGIQGAGYHIFNVILSGCIICALFAMTKRWTKNQALALTTCVIFALHPIHSEAVAWVSDITDLEVALFIFLAFWAYLGLDRSRGFAWRRQLAIAGLFALALLSKEIAVALPMLALVFEHFYREDRNETSFPTKVSRYAGLWVMLGLFFIYRHIVLGPFGSKPHRPELNAYATTLSGFQLFGGYVYKFLWPWKLHVYYVFHATHHVWEFGAVFGIISAAALLLTGLLCLRRQPIISFGIVWYFAFILLALNVQWLATAAFAERYLFVPSVGFSWICALGVLWLWQWSPRMNAAWRPALATAATVGLLVAFVRIYTRNRDWHDSQALYEGMLQGDPNADAIRNDLGVIYWNAGQRELAIQSWDMAHQQNPISYSPMVNLGMAAVLSGDWPTAEKWLDQAAILWPKVSDPHEWLGVMRERQGRYAEAEQEMLKAEALSPYNTSDYNNLAHLYAKEGKLEDAVQQMKRSAELMDDPLSWDDLGDYYLKLGQVDDAEHAYRAALDSNKYDSESHVGLGEVYERQGDKTRAEKEYAIGLEKQPNNPIAIAGLARLRQSESN